MKILVFSDSHGHPSLMQDVIRAHMKAGGLERVFFLGDGLHDLYSIREQWPMLTIDAVAGNCDGTLSFFDGADEPLERIADVGGMRFLLMHGHKYSVKSTIQPAADRGIARGADVVLFGHTHEAFDEVVDGSDGGSVRLINPGSVGTWYDASFALLEIINGSLICSFGGQTK